MTVGDTLSLHLPDWATNPGSDIDARPKTGYYVEFNASRDVFRAAVGSTNQISELKLAGSGSSPLGLATLGLRQSLDSSRSETVGLVLRESHLKAVGYAVLQRAVDLQEGSMVHWTQTREIKDPADDPHLLLMLMRGLAVAVAEYPSSAEAGVAFDRFNNVSRNLPEDPRIALAGVINIGRSTFSNSQFIASAV